MDNQTPLPQPQQPLPAPPPPNGVPFSAPPQVPPQPQPPMSNSSLPPSSMPETPVTVGDPRQQVIEHIKETNTVLVTVSNNPSVDQLASCIALTLLLNKLGKHATAVFSGEVPSTIEFLQPEKTLEKNTDSLRDFIISLDKDKADRLRYKIEDKFVKIFITPYKTSISEDDLEFTQGDLNCDLIIALGVHQQQDLDQAIVAHGRILHDATTIAINISPENNNIGNINWIDTSASSLSELITGITPDIGPKNLLDTQTATSLLTGIVAATSRFSNDKTSPKTMNASAVLMAAGANQQLVATKLEPPPPPPPEAPPTAETSTTPPTTIPPSSDATPATTVHSSEKPSSEGELKVQDEESGPITDISQFEDEPEQDDIEKIRIDNQGLLHRDDSVEASKDGSDTETDGHHLLQGSEPTALSGASYEALPSEPGNASSTLPPVVVADNTTAAPSQKIAEVGSHDNETLSQIEQEVGATHASSGDSPNPAADAARSEAMAESTPSAQPESLNSQPLGPDLRTPASNNEQTMSLPVPPNVINPTEEAPSTETSTDISPSSAPPVPPPIIRPLPPNGQNTST